jgi:uncharacterized protein YndB with AHSA1/START domain
MKQEQIDSVDAVRREVRNLERDGQPARAVVLERTYDTTVDDVWDAVTSRERIPRWFAPVEGDLKLGGRYQIQGNASGEVTACDPPTHLALTWEFGGAVSWVDVHLGEDPDGGARLRLEHVALVDDSELWDQFGPGAAGIGWDLSLFGLAEYLRTGAAVAEHAEAPVDEAGARFMARSGDAWCEADIASGTPDDDARARAARTLAFYTGGGDALHGDAPPEGEAPAAPANGQGGSEGGSRTDS